LATITLLGHRAHTHQVLLQTRANDQWGFYKGKANRRATNEVVAKLMTTLDYKDKEKADKVRESLTADADRYRDELKEIEKEAKDLQDEARREQQRANRFDLSEGFLEAALVITSITLLTRRRVYWGVGGAIAVIGIVVALTALTVH